MADRAATAARVATAVSPVHLRTFCVVIISVSIVMGGLDKTPPGASHP